MQRTSCYWGAEGCKCWQASGLRLSKHEIAMTLTDATQANVGAAVHAFAETPEGQKLIAARALELMGERAPNFSGQGDPRFFKILHEMAEVHVKKAADYGSDEDPLANLRASVSWGSPAWIGALMRLNDKIVRLQAFAKKGVLANESARDSMIDIAAYAILATILYDEESSSQ